MKLENFLDTDLRDYASYSNIRMIASYIDGLKNGARKVVYTVLEKNIKSKIKVSQLASKTSEFTEYLHGEGSLGGVIVTLGQSFVGTNNLPILKANGNFGNRHEPCPAAPRYIYASGSDDFFKLFNKDDLNILISQEFEGQTIEPLFFVPSLPLILINGSEGIAEGFKQKILPRNIKAIQKYIFDILNNKEPDERLLTPYFNGFKGSVVKGEDNWLIKGKISRVDRTKLKITEIPIGYDLISYIKVLDSLKDQGKINGYIDKSDSEKDTFEFTVKLDQKLLDELSENELLEYLKLVKPITEKYICIDEHDRVKVFNSAQEIILAYIEIKKKYLQLRKDYQLKILGKTLDINQNKYRFIEMIANDELIINKKPKEQIEKDLIKNEFMKIDNSYDYLLNMSIHSLTKERMKTLKEQVKSIKENINNLKKTSINEMFINDLKEI